jgi:hypothetical protein
MSTLQDCFNSLPNIFHVITIYKVIIDGEIVFMNEKQYISYMRKKKIENLNIL